MKKILFKITALIMIFVLALSFAGCSLFDTGRVPDSGDNGVNSGGNVGDNGGNGSNSANGGGVGNGDYVNNGGAVNLPAIEEIAKEVQFGRLEEGNRTEKKKTEVIADVRSSVVAIALGTSAGSGVIVDMKLTDKEGKALDNENEFYVLTCHHVVDGKGDITIYLPDAEMDNYGESDYNSQDYTFKGKIGGETNDDMAVTLIGGDQKSDVALLKVKINNALIAKRVVKAKLAPDTYSMMVGEDVIAIGNPGGDLPGTASVGTISYLNRETSVGGVGALTLIQINVDIYHGSSGGALFNMYGELIGITNAGRDGVVGEDGTVQTYSGLNFAIPYIVDKNSGADDYGFLNVASQLLITKTANNYGYVDGRAGMFGFTTTQQLNSTVVQITAVTENSLAYGKLYVGDKIQKAVKGDKSALASAPTITSNAEVTAIFKTVNAGDKVSLLVARPGAGNVEVEMTAVQYIFCDTGIYE